MPPSPIIKAVLDDVRYKELCESLGLASIPFVRIRMTERPNAAVQLLGNYRFSNNSIEVSYGFPSDAIEKLRFVQSELVSTLLHETRHAWQYATWGFDFMVKDDLKPYHAQMKEKDANEFAATHQAAYRGLVKVTRRHHGSGFSKLGRHTSRRMV